MRMFKLKANLTGEWKITVAQCKYYSTVLLTQSAVSSPDSRNTIDGQPRLPLWTSGCQNKSGIILFYRLLCSTNTGLHWIKWFVCTDFHLSIFFPVVCCLSSLYFIAVVNSIVICCCQSLLGTIFVSLTRQGSSRYQCSGHSNQFKNLLADWLTCILKGKQGETLIPWTRQNYLSWSRLFAESAKLSDCLIQHFLNPFRMPRHKMLQNPLQWKSNSILTPCVFLSLLPLWLMYKQTLKLVEMYSICWHEKYRKLLWNVIHPKPWILCNNYV